MKTRNKKNIEKPKQKMSKNRGKTKVKIEKKYIQAKNKKKISKIGGTNIKKCRKNLTNKPKHQESKLGENLEERQAKNVEIIIIIILKNREIGGKTKNCKETREKK